MNVWELEKYVGACHLTIVKWVRMYGFPPPKFIRGPNNFGRTRIWNQLEVDIWLSKNTILRGKQNRLRLETI